MRALGLGLGLAHLSTAARDLSTESGDGHWEMGGVGHACVRVRVRVSPPIDGSEGFEY